MTYSLHAYRTRNRIRNLPSATVAVNAHRWAWYVMWLRNVKS